MSFLAMALAAQIEVGANASEDLKPCPNPAHKLEKPRVIKPSLIKHKRVGKAVQRPAITDCAEGPPPSPFVMLFPERTEPVDYTPAPEQETFAGAPEADLREESVPPSEQSISHAPEGGESLSGAPAFITNYGPSIAIYTPVSPAPEPQAWFLLLAGMGALVWRRRV